MRSSTDFHQPLKRNRSLITTTKALIRTIRLDVVTPGVTEGPFAPVHSNRQRKTSGGYRANPIGSRLLVMRISVADRVHDFQNITVSLYLLPVADRRAAISLSFCFSQTPADMSLGQAHRSR